MLIHTPAEFRNRFPSLQDTHYLASCSLGARSVDLDACLDRMLQDMTSGAAWDHFEDQVRESRERFALLIGAETSEIALVPSASVGAYQVASVMQWNRRPVIVTSAAEFPSLAHVWLAQRPRGADVCFAGPSDGTLRADDYLSAIDRRCGLVSIPLVAYRDGARLPVSEIIEAARAVGARTFVDAYQAVGVESVNVSKLNCDYLVAGATKYLLGLPGLAFLYVRSTCSDEAMPQLTGWFGRVDPKAFDPFRLDFPTDARRFETGTPAVPAAYAANAGMELIRSLDLNVVRRHVESLTAYAGQCLAADGERLTGPVDPTERGAHIAFLDSDPGTLAHWLRERRIIVSPRGNVVRISFHFHSSMEDVEAICDAIRSLRRTSRSVRPVCTESSSSK